MKAKATFNKFIRVAVVAAFVGYWLTQWVLGGLFRESENTTLKTLSRASIKWSLFTPMASENYFLYYLYYYPDRTDTLEISQAINRSYCQKAPFNTYEALQNAQIHRMKYRYFMVVHRHCDSVGLHYDSIIYWHRFDDATRKAIQHDMEKSYVGQHFANIARLVVQDSGLARPQNFSYGISEKKIAPIKEKNREAPENWLYLSPKMNFDYDIQK